MTLPKSVVVVNGSGSHDDLNIAKYLWTRMPGSLAAGKILGSSNTESALLLVNLVPGLYIFQLQVGIFFVETHLKKKFKGGPNRSFILIKCTEQNIHANPGFR